MLQRRLRNDCCDSWIHPRAQMNWLQPGKLSDRRPSSATSTSFDDPPDGRDDFGLGDRNFFSLGQVFDFPHAFLEFIRAGNERYLETFLLGVLELLADL